MSVPRWKRTTSKTDFIRYLMDLNIRLGKIVGNKPKKYKQNYGDHLIKIGLSALEHAEIGNSIYMTADTQEADYLMRRKCFAAARGEINHLSTAAYIFMEICKNSNEVRADKILKEEEYIGSMCADISKSLSGVMRSDKKLMRKTG